MNMTEWDKMQEHQIYNDFDADLFDLRVEAKNLSLRLQFIESLNTKQIKQIN